MPHPVTREDAHFGKVDFVRGCVDLERLYVREVRGRPNGYYSDSPSGRVEVEPGDGRMRQMAAQKGSVQAAGGLQIIDVAAFPADQSWIFDAPLRRAKNRPCQRISV